MSPVAFRWPWLTRQIQGIRSGSKRRARPRSSPRKNSWRQNLIFEQLEDRTLLSSGVLDTTFGQGGHITTDFIGPGVSIAQKVLISGDRTVEVGRTDAGSQGNIAIARYNLTDGSLDRSFGQGGQLITGGLGNGHDAVLQSDGKVIVLADVGLVRYNTDGSLDTTFVGGGDGRAVDYSGKGLLRFYVFNGQVTHLALQGDEIIVAGDEYNGSDYDFALTRLNNDGSVDTTFGNNGLTTIDFGVGFDYLNAVAVDSDGSITVVGNHNAPDNSSSSLVVAHLTASGGLDTGFNSSGKAILTDASGHAGGEAVAVQQDHRILVGGVAGWDCSILLRYNPDGTVDGSFTGSGEVMIPGAGYDSLAVRGDGKILAGSQNNDIIRSYNTDGSLDSAFNGGSGYSGVGILMTTIAVNTDGSIVAGGSTFAGNEADFAVQKFTAAGAMDTSFNGSGIVTSSFNGSRGGIATNLAIVPSAELSRLEIRALGSAMLPS